MPVGRRGLRLGRWTERRSDRSGTAQSAWGPAANGNITIALPTVVNKYANVTNDPRSAGTSITVGNIADLGPPAVGDLVMVMQMQGATINATNTDQYGNVTNLNGAGTFEFVHIQAIQGNTLTAENGCGGLCRPTCRGPHAGHPDALSTTTINNGGSIIPLAWNGGGVVIRAAGAITLNGNVHRRLRLRLPRRLDNAASTTGITSFRGTQDVDGAQKGESIAGFTAEALRSAAPSAAARPRTEAAAATRTTPAAAARTAPRRRGNGQAS